jgi:hypothetical protein
LLGLEVSSSPTKHGYLHWNFDIRRQHVRDFLSPFLVVELSRPGFNTATHSIQHILNAN